MLFDNFQATQQYYASRNYEYKYSQTECIDLGEMKIFAVINILLRFYDFKNVKNMSS